MSGETDLDRLIAGMEPALHPEIFVFVTLRGQPMPTGLTPRMVFEEDEGRTLILTRAQAETHGLGFEFPCRMITLNVHSALQAVGFIARIATALAAEGMGVNPVAGYFHDHLFVPEDRAADAMAILRALAEDRASRG